MRGGDEASAAAGPIDAGLRPARLHIVVGEVADGIIAPPTDALDTTDPGEQGRGPLAALLDPDPATDGAVAGRVARTGIQGLIASGAYRDLGPVLAFHEREREGRRQRGLIGVLPLSTVDDGRLRGHESTDPTRVATLAAFLDTAGFDASPVLVAHRPLRLLDEVHAELVAAHRPDLDVVARDGTVHRVHVVSDPDTVARLARAVEDAGPLTIVDGHHRTAAALAGTLRPEGLLVELIPSDQLAFRGFDRVVSASPALTVTDLLQVARGFGVVTDLTADATAVHRPAASDRVVLGLGGGWWDLALDAGRARGRPAVSIVDDEMLPALASGGRSIVVGTIPGTGTPEDVAGRAGPEDLLVLLPAIDVATIEALAATGTLLPPKSTAVERKADRGVVLRIR